MENIFKDTTIVHFLFFVLIFFIVMWLEEEFGVITKCMELGGYLKKKKELEKRTQTAYITIRIKKIFGKTATDNGTVLWEHELNGCNDPAVILFDLAKSEASGTTAGMIYAGIDVIEDDGTVNPNYTVRLPEAFLVKYLNERKVWEKGINHTCRKLHFSEDLQTYDIYFDLFSDHDLLFIAKKIYDKPNIDNAISSIKMADKEGIIVISKMKDQDVVVKQYVSRILSGTDACLTELEGEVMKALDKGRKESLHSDEEVKFSDVRIQVRNIDDQLANGGEIPGISESKWDLYRSEILVLLDRDLAAAQQERIRNVLDKIRRTMIFSEKKKESFDTDVAIKAVENAVSIDKPAYENGISTGKQCTQGRQEEYIHDWK